ncbi:MAG: hypothetical protein K2M94_07300 [Paramuribaculum sp.]|nr:hypothetical protein [Paramuribaculum sp.]
MKLNIRHISLLSLALAASLGSSAQNTRSGYFLPDYTYRYEMNPAYENSLNFVSMPVLGNLNVNMHGTLGVSDVLYNIDGRTTTFLNPGISASEVMDNIGNSNRIGADIKITLLAAGFKAFGGYNTVTINARTSMGVRVPRSLFSLLKEGVTNNTYDITDFGARASAYGELALGHSHKINDKWRVGGALKILLGGAYMDARLNHAQLQLGTNDWSVVSNGEISASVKGLKYDTDINENTNHRYVSGADIDGTGLNGFGMAFDFGATYKPNKDWTLSLAFLDLGFISWNNNMLASTGGDKTFNTDRYTFNVDENKPNGFDNEWNKIKDDLSQLYELDDMGDQGSTTHGLGATMNLGVEYTLPAYRKLTFGLLNTTRIEGDYSWTEFRLSANIAPVKCFDASINMGAGTFGVGFGWLLNLHTKGFNMFLGMDHTLGKVTKQFVPLSSNASVNFGLNFPF